MIYSLRRRHFITWIILAVVLTVLFILSWMAIPENPTKKINANKLIRAVEDVHSDNRPWAQASLFQLPIRKKMTHRLPIELWV